MRVSRFMSAVAIPTIASLAIAATSPSASAIDSDLSRESTAANAVQRLADTRPELVQATIANEDEHALARTIDTAGRTVQLSKNGTVSFTNSDGTSIGITPNIDGLLMSPKLTKGVFTYEGTRGISATVAINTAGAQAFCVFENEQAPEACKFNFDMPRDYKLAIKKDGSATVLDSANADVLNIGSPFAYGSNGARVDTAYTVEGNTLTQAVHHKDDATAYPVVADPGVDWGRLGTFTACFTGAGGAIGAVLVILSIGGTAALINVAKYGRPALPGLPWWANYAVPIIQRCSWAITG